MANKSMAMLYFVITLIVCGPIAIACGLIGAAWAIQSIGGCIFSLSYVCGQTEWLKAIVFGGIAYGCVVLILKMWGKAK
jgi:hypothetical protein